MGDFTHLTLRTSYSLRGGSIRPRELAAAAAALGFTRVAITDRDGLYGAVRIAQACAVTGVTPVFGADLALAPDPHRPGWSTTRGGRHRPRTSDDRQVPDGSGAGTLEGGRVSGPGGRPDWHRWGQGVHRRPAVGPAWLEDDAPRVTFLARDQRGYGDLCRLVSAAHREVRSSPHLRWEDAAGEGVYVLLGADSPVGRLVAAGQLAAAADEARRWVEVFGRGAVLVGVRHHIAEGDDLRAARMVRLADEAGLTPVAVNDVRYLTRDDAYLADVLHCVRAQVPVGAHHVDRTTAEAWLKTADEMARIPIFAQRPDLLRNAAVVAASCEVDLGLHDRPHVPRLTGLTADEAARELRTRAWIGVHDRFDRVSHEVTERLRHELAMVDQLGLHDYFLAVADIVAGIRDMGVLCACRGSAAGSLVCYALRISDVDPVGNDLVFERFMNPHRDELPDIDIDVESARREDVYRMVMARYGGERTACVAMVETFQARMAVREVGKVLDLPPAEIDLVAKAFRRVRAKDVRAAMATLPELRGSRLDAGQLERLFQVVERIDGFPRHLALHPCGILLADTHLVERTPLERSANGFTMSQFDKDDVAAMGLLKLDVLAVRLLSAMRQTIDLLPEPIDFHDIPPEDPEVYALLGTTRSIGVFQVESPGQRELLGRLQPDRFGDLVTEISLFRPGPVKADMVGPFVARRTGEEQPPELHPLLEPILRETFGVIVYHEQVMRVIAALTGCDLSYADLVRRELADERTLDERRRWALGRAAERGLAAGEAEAIWKQVASFASFGFCKAHAAAFAVPTYRSAWLKLHHLPQFIAGLLTHDPGMYPRRLILDEARQFGVVVLGPDVEVSMSEYTVERVPDRLEGPPSAGTDLGAAPDGTRWAVRIGLQDVKGMSDTERERLIAGRPYASLADVRRRAGISRPTAEMLCKAGAFDRWSTNRRATMLTVEELWRGRGRASGADQPSFDLHADHVPQLPAPTGADAVRDELEALGLDWSEHVVSFYEPIFEPLGVVRARDLVDRVDGERVRVAGVRVALQSPPVRSGQRVLFLSLDDGTGTSQSNFFASVLDRTAWTVLNAWLVVVEGRVRRQGRRGVTLVAERAWDLTVLWRAWRQGRLAEALDRDGPPLALLDGQADMTP